MAPLRVDAGFDDGCCAVTSLDACGEFFDMIRGIQTDWFGIQRVVVAL